MILIDPPNAPGHGRLWSHLASDTDYAELHVFAERLGIPHRGFDRDHYDVPQEWYERVVAAGARPVDSRELVTRLVRAGLRRRKSEVLRPRAPGRGLLVPAPTSVGARVAVVAPSGPLRDPALLTSGSAILASWGLEVVPPAPGDRAEVPWHAASDQHRAAELTAAWLDPDVAAVWCLRGGVGAHRVLDHLDWRSLAMADPKWLIGHSDITALHQAFAARLGVATLLASGLCGLPSRSASTLADTRSLVMAGTATPVAGRSLVPGSASGPLVGGNLSVLAAGIGSDTVRTARGSIAVLEDVHEQPYRLDRTLTQMLRAGWFDGVEGVVCGTFVECGDPEVVRRLLRLRLEPLGVPVLVDAPFGHAEDNHPLPLGVRASLLVGPDGGELRPSIER